MNKNRTLIILLSVVTFLTGCTTTYKNYATKINAYETAKFGNIVQGMPLTDVHAQLGFPVFRATFSNNKMLERYYSENLKYEKEIGQYTWSYITYRDTEVIDIWYKNGEVDKTQHISKIKEYKREPNERYSRLFENSINSALARPYPIIGLEYDLIKSDNIKKGDSVSKLLWTLGVPNRVVSTARGEKFIYENGDFNIEKKDNSFKDYYYSKSVFTVQNGAISEIEQIKENIDLTLPIKENDSDFYLLFNFIFTWHARGSDSYQHCLDENDTSQCNLNDYEKIIGGKWKKHPDLVKLSYYLSDLDLGDVRQDIMSFYNKLSDFSQNESRDTEVELYYILKSTIRSGLIVGEDSFDSIFSSKTHKPYKNEIESEKGELAKNWLNVVQPNKWYFTQKGKLDAKLSFSLISPMSPWYAFGPPSEHTAKYSIDEGIEKCSRSSDNCVKKLSKIYSGNITYPQL